MKKIITSVIALGMAITASAQQHTFMFETFNTDDSAVEEIVDTYTLNNCTEYTLTVDGTYSIWPAGFWSANSCGTPEISPMYPSPLVANNGRVGFDMEYIFSIFPANGGICDSLPDQTDRIEISTDGGVNWDHPTATGATAAFNQATHSYDYIIMGEGFPLQVRHISALNSDDYGQLRFQIFQNPLPDPCSVVPAFETFPGKCGIQFIDNTNLPCAAGFQILGSHYDFGDGTSSTDFNPKHAYTAPGTYTVQYTLWLTNGDECCKVTGSKQVNVSPKTICDPCESVLLNVDFESSNVGSTFTFAQTGISGDWDFGYYWDFGDGNFSSDPNPQHTYADNGTFQVCLTLFYFNEQTGDCCKRTVCHTITIGSGKNASLNSSNTDVVTEMNLLTVFPNPANEFVTIEHKLNRILTVRLVDLAGKTVISKENRDLNNSIKLDVSTIKPGLYNVIVESPLGEVSTSKIVLK